MLTKFATHLWPFLIFPLKSLVKEYYWVVMVHSNSANNKNCFKSSSEHPKHLNTISKGWQRCHKFLRFIRRGVFLQKHQARHSVYHPVPGIYKFMHTHTHTHTDTHRHTQTHTDTHTHTHTHTPVLFHMKSFNIF